MISPSEASYSRKPESLSIAIRQQTDGEGGAIVNVSSAATRLAPVGLSAYTVSKAAVDMLTVILGKELQGRDITVNAVAPGPTRTLTFLSTTRRSAQRELAELAPLARSFNC